METPEVLVVGGEDTPMTEVPATQDEAATTAAPAESATAQDVLSQDATAARDEPASAPAKKNAGLQFLSYLTSPIVELVVGQGETETVLTAHQNLLTESPLLAEAIEKFKNTGSRRIHLPNESVVAFGCFLQYQYTGDYSPLQHDPPTGEDSDGEIDQSGEHLLKHAKVYTLAEKLGVPALKTLSHSKIHRIHSTAKGEIAYARYVYGNTAVDDAIIRKPVAAYWAHRSHQLRHEAEEDFRQLCLEVPLFAFDVLSLVLDQKEKKAHDKAESESGIRGSARKRPRDGV